MPVKAKPIAERFWAGIAKSESGCWEWTGWIRRDGYAYMSLGGRGAGKAPVHRVSWELSHGEIPEGKFIDHLCHNRKCANPDHLRVVTKKQNNEHKQGAQRSGSTGVRGVTWDKQNKKYRAQLMHNRQHVHIGRFDTLEEAAEAARLKRIELFTHSDADRRNSA